MSGVLGGVIAVVVGGVLAGLATFGLVSSQTATPAAVDKPFVVYGNS